MAKKAAGKTTAKKKAKKNIGHAIVHVYATFNNTIVTFADRGGNTVSWGSAGTAGFKGSRKSTPFAAGQAAEKAARVAVDNGVVSADIHIKGPGPGRESAVRSIQAAGIRINVIKDVTPLPHNGVRPPKRRRV